ETVPEGQVIGITDRADGGWWRGGDKTTLIVSTGPPLFPIPDVKGLTRDEAIAKLEGEGFQVDYPPYWAPFPDVLTEVNGSDPGGGAMPTKGTRVTIDIGPKE